MRSRQWKFCKVILIQIAMNETFIIQGIILKRDDFRETESRILIYSLEKGLLELIARGTKSPKSKLAAHLEPMSFVEIMVIRGKTYDYVGSALACDCFRNIKEDYSKILTAGTILRRLGEILKTHEVDEVIFFLLLDFLSSLNNTERTFETKNLFKEFFIFKLLVPLGYQPVLDTCLVCGELSFTASLVAVDFLKKIRDNDFGVIFKLQIEDNIQRELKNIINSFEKYHLNYN